MPSAPQFRSEFLRTFAERGAYYDCSAPTDLDALFLKERVTAYIGFDCTASSMHIGNLVQLMTLRRLQQAGHRPILLMGGGTTKLGDPSGKDDARKLLSDTEIEANKKSMLAGVSHLLKFGAARPMRSWSTTPNGSTNSNTFHSSATSVGISPSIAC